MNDHLEVKIISILFNILIDFKSEKTHLPFNNYLN